VSEPAGIDAAHAHYDLVSLAVLVSDYFAAGQPESAQDLLRRRLRRAFEAGRLQGRREIQTDGKFGPNPWDRSGWLEAGAVTNSDGEGAAL
jgi:hypothetical protein